MKLLNISSLIFSLGLCLGVESAFGLEAISAAPDSSSQIKPILDTNIASLKSPLSDSSQVAQNLDSLPPSDTSKSQPKTDSSLTVKKEKRKLIVKESSVNTIDEMKGKYRSPKKALFMSLLVPGLGQAYIGGTASWVRAPLYFLADIGLGIGWYHFTVTKYNRAEKKYKRFADTHWDRKRYEDTVYEDYRRGISIDTIYHPEYCESIYPKSQTQLLKSCKDPAFNRQEYTGSFKGFDSTLYNADSIGRDRTTYFEPEIFYEDIAIYWQFLRGWDDNKDVRYVKSTTKDIQDSIYGTSAHREEYKALRLQANDYARMETWFLGGIFLNHIISALDAGLTAHWHNKALYQTDVAWYDGIRMRPLLTVLPRYSSLGFLASLPF